ncbi:MAG: hypothetical protein ACTSSH_00850 [Candidatus Heimdallarchaeota archaeon]
MRTRQILVVSLISFMIFLLPLANVNAYTWNMVDDTCDVRYYDTEGVFQDEGCYHGEIDIVSMKLEGSNIIIELSENYPTNSCYYRFHISIKWESVPLSDPGTYGEYGGCEGFWLKNFVKTLVYDEEGVIEINETSGIVTHSGPFITFPIPLFEDLPYTTPYYAECGSSLQPDGGLTGEKYRDNLNGTFTRTASTPGFTYWVFTVGLVTVLALFSYKKSRND